MRSKPPNRTVSVALVSLGCAKNLVDSERMLALLAEGGCTVGAPVEEADAIVVNTCGFLAAAREESLGVIREALAHKRKKGVRVVVAGCLATRDGKKLFREAPGIDAVLGVHERQHILAAVTGKTPFARASVSAVPARAVSDAGRFRLTPRHTAYLRISEGCSQRCTFCTIPMIRGPLRSKPPEMVLTEARELVADGATELNVIAQDTTSYGRDLRDEPSRGPRLASLLKSLDKLDGVRWIRLLYTYPRRFTDELIETLAAGERVVKYVDLPLQHISDGVLRRMGRGVSRKTIETLLGKLRRIKGLAIRTTFIVGFPGETQREFEELLDLVREFRFDAMGAFEFSREEGSVAASFPGQIPDEVKAERARQIMLAQQEIAFAANARRVGKCVEILVDGRAAKGRCVGRAYFQAPDTDSVCLLTRCRQAGSYIRGVVKDYRDYDLVVEPTA
jgi:ribosomal protein S12 methylthiotransferase